MSCGWMLSSRNESTPAFSFAVPIRRMPGLRLLRQEVRGFLRLHVDRVQVHLHIRSLGGNDRKPRFQNFQVIRRKVRRQVVGVIDPVARRALLRLHGHRRERCCRSRRSARHRRQLLQRLPVIVAHRVLQPRQKIHELEIVRVHRRFGTWRGCCR